MVVAFGGAGLVLYARKPDGYGAFLGVAFVLVGTSIAGMVTIAPATYAPLLLGSLPLQQPGVCSLRRSPLLT